MFLTARKGGTPLFYSRPEGSSKDNVWGNNRIGERGNSNFKNDEVKAAISFRHAMANEPENIETTENGAVAAVVRGDKGLVIINFTEKEQKFELPTSLPDGEYTDMVYSTTFKVKKGKISGKVMPLQSHIIVK